VRDEDEDYRLEKIRVAKMRGKGAPKKKRSAAGTYNLVIWRGEIADWARREQEVDEEETGWEQVMDGSKTLWLFGLHCTALLAGWIDGQRKGLVLLMESSTWARNRMQGFTEGVNHHLCLRTKLRLFSFTATNRSLYVLPNRRTICYGSTEVAHGH